LGPSIHEEVSAASGGAVSSPFHKKPMIFHHLC
jgi:hypothetical protein